MNLIPGHQLSVTAVHFTFFPRNIIFLGRQGSNMKLGYLYSFLAWPQTASFVLSLIFFMSNQNKKESFRKLETFRLSSQAVPCRTLLPGGVLLPSLLTLIWSHWPCKPALDGSTAPCHNLKSHHYQRGLSLG